MYWYNTHNPIGSRLPFPFPIQGSNYHSDDLLNDCVGTVASQYHYPLVSPLIPTPLYLHVVVRPIKAACPVHH